MKSGWLIGAIVGVGLLLLLVAKMSSLSGLVKPLSVRAAADREAGQKIYQSRCFVCHGRDGRGGGPSIKGLLVQPQDLTRPEWQSKMDNESIRKIIQAGGPSVGKSISMPANPDLSSNQIDSLVLYVRSLTP